MAGRLGRCALAAGIGFVLVGAAPTADVTVAGLQEKAAAIETYRCAAERMQKKAFLKDGKVEGRMIPAAKIEFTNNGTVEVESLGTVPFRLMNVRQREP